MKGPLIPLENDFTAAPRLTDVFVSFSGVVGPLPGPKSRDMERI